ncbi:MAG: site-specific DNA-methyltransferase [Candidatus Onthovivens sp.]|nr:site-specific DNA-methyltransferase [Candidatus Onthovivens sp.]
MSVIFENCDYVDLVKRMKKQNIKVDLIFTDPPYCVSRDYQLGFSNMGRAGMNYGQWDYNFDQKKWISDVSDLVKDGGSIIIFNDWKNFSYVVEELEKNGFLLKDLIRWEKGNPMPRNVNSRYLSDCEFAIWAVKGKGKWTFNKPKEVPFLKPVYRSGVVPGGKKRIHPTQKNLQVIEDIIKVHSNEGDTVFDPFSGSGTTALGCIHLNRNFIGCEIDENYYTKAMKRLCL